MQSQPSTDRKEPSSISGPRDRLIAIFTAVSIATYLLGRFAFHYPHAVFVLYLAVLAGGVPIVFDLIRKAFRMDFGSDLLAGFSIVTAALLHQYLVAAIVVLMLPGGSALDPMGRAMLRRCYGRWRNVCLRRRKLSSMK